MSSTALLAPEPALETADLGPDSVHAFVFTLEALKPYVELWRRLLTPEERTRSERFYFPHLKTNYVLSRGLLRTLLGHYLKCHNDSVVILTDSKGKPYLGAGTGRLKFNLSHAGDRVAVALALDCDLGVDVECVRPLDEMAEIARQHFCLEECADLEGTGPPFRETAFFQCWTRKEAYIKALGEGLSHSLQRFRVALLPGEPARFLHIDGDPQEAAHWTLHDLAPGEGYVGALALRSTTKSIEVRSGSSAEAFLAGLRPAGIHA